MPANCLSNISHKFLKRFLAILDELSRNFVTEMKLLYWAPSYPTFHLLNWSLGRNFPGYLRQICSGGGGSPLVWSPALVFQPPGGGWGGAVVGKGGKGAEHSWKTVGTKLTFDNV